MMPISRRALLGRLGAGAAAALSAPGLAADSLRATRGGRPPDTTRLTGSDPLDMIRLNRNENAYGPSAAVIAAIRETASDEARQYPDLAAGALRRQIAHLHGVTPDHVVLGCGSGELLRAAVDAFAGPQKTIIAAVPTFESVAVCAKRAGAEVVGVPLRKDFSHDLGAMLARSSAATGLVYVCNPNSPTGSLTPRQELDAFLRELPATSIVLIDEAYHHYVGESSDYVSFLDRPVDDPRVIVTRSFSKIHGLAGLRVGYAVAAPRTARVLASHGLPDGVSVVAARAASAALDDGQHVRMSVSRNTDDRQEFLNQAIARMLRVDSVANFVMLPTGRPASDVVERFRAHRILVAGPVPAFEQNIRVSLGTPGEMREFWRVWDLLPGGHPMAM